MRGLLEQTLRFLLRKMRYDIVPFGVEDSQETSRAIVDRVKPFTMASASRIVAFCDSIDYVTRAQIEGDIVECGVWKGGSIMAAALKLLELQSTHRDLWLYDTFSGMSDPTSVDRDIHGCSAESQLANADARTAVAAFSPLEEVKKSMESTGYPSKRIRYVSGKVEDTLPSSIPEKIAVLRLDTDWYESTRHELIYLYPRLSPGGVLIIDDYGHWDGSRRAVDEYFSDHNHNLLLHRIDYSGRLVVKPSG